MAKIVSLREIYILLSSPWRIYSEGIGWTDAAGSMLGRYHKDQGGRTYDIYLLTHARIQASIEYFIPAQGSSTTTFFALTPSFILSQASWSLSRPWPMTSGSGLHCNVPFARAAGIHLPQTDWPTSL